MSGRVGEMVGTKSPIPTRSTGGESGSFGGGISGALNLYCGGG